jgi:hypothetical protein
MVLIVFSAAPRARSHLGQVISPTIHSFGFWRSISLTPVRYSFKLVLIIPAQMLVHCFSII